MWLSGQQKRPAQESEGQTGTVTMSGGELAVELDSERRGLEVYGPAGYRWTPQVGQRALVIQGRGEIPCVAGVRQDAAAPEKVAIEAGRLDLQAEVEINGEPLDNYIARILARLLGGGG